MTYGQIIPGLVINGEAADYPVVNERAIRATAGIMFVIGFFAFFNAFFLKDFAYMYFVVPAFWLDFLLKTVFGPKYSIFGFFGRLFVKGQKPEYVGVIQKRFAWGIGLLLSSIMMVAAVGLGVRGVLPLSICLTCLFFMWMETALGICVGCKIYQYLLKKGIMPRPKTMPACPGGVCSIKKN